MPLSCHLIDLCPTLADDAGPIRVNDQRLSIIENFLIGRPTADDLGLDIKSALVEALREKQAARKKLMLVRTMAGCAGQEDDLVGRVAMGNAECASENDAGEV